MRVSGWFVAAAVAAFSLIGGALVDQVEPRLTYADEASDAEAARHFETRIAPLLARHCLECHDSAAKQGGLDLSRKEAALKGGENGPAIVPGKRDDSLLWAYVESDEMPKNRPPLSRDDKRLLRRWIDGGAVWSLDVIEPSASAGDGRVAENWVRRLTVPEYIETVRSAVGVDIERDARRLLPRDLRADGFTNTAYSLNVDLGHIEAYATLARNIAGRLDVVAFAAEHTAADAVRRKLRASASPELSEAEVREVIAGVGKWLQRGPLEPHEVDAFLRIATFVREEGGDSAEALRFVVEAMLQSPRFIYRVELQRGDGASRPVGGYELASRLSYTLWGGPPDKELMRAAEAGELSDRSRVEAQVRRMLEDPRAIRRSLQFIHEWMDLDRLATLRPNPERFPGWNEQLAADMRDETLAFFEDVAWKQQRPLWELMNAKVTYATPRLAAHYGLDQGLPRSRKAAADLLSVAVRGSATGAGAERVTSGLQALYTFDEGRGDTVRDVSRAGAPLDLVIPDRSAVGWSASGLGVSKPTIVATRLPPRRLVDAVVKANAITVEAWVTPANTSQAGPARIVTFSADSSARNITLGQDGDKYEVRLRTTSTGPNGTPGLSSPSGAVETRLTHVVYTRDAAGKARIYVNGEEVAAGDVGGELSNWEPQDREASRRPAGHRLAFANELTQDRPWQGTLHLVAFYDRALSPDDVRRNHAAGARPTTHTHEPAAQARTPADASPASPRVTNDLEALYTFDEGGGDTVRDVSSSGEPLNLKIENASAVKWDRGRLTVNGSTLIATASSAKRLTDAVKRSKGVTIEAWVTPANASQAGPARIVTLSDGVLARNFTLGQDADKFDVRFRTTKTDGSGLPSLSSPGAAVQTKLTHVVYTRDPAGKAKLYIDGQERADRDVGNDLSNWDGAFRLALANETSKDRPWRGTFDLVAVYSRALSADDVRRNHAAGAQPEAAPALAAATVGVDRGRHDLQALYTFEEGRGDTVRDTSEAGEPLHLKIENASAVRWGAGQLALNGSTLVATAGHAKRLTDAVKQSKAITLEAWITPGHTNQSGPARILTLSSGIGARNFTLGQEGDRFDVRFRGARTDANGNPSLSSPGGTVQTRLTHVVYTRDAAGQTKLYIDGEERAAGNVAGDLSNWDAGFRLAIGNETSKDRPWRGTFHRLAIYSRALTPEEIRSDAGPARYDLASVPARGGLLTQGSVLTVGGDEASMVSRGLFVLTDLLYSRVGNPPPCVDTSPVPTKPGMSQRAVAEARLADASCTGCHSRFEPLAFGLEKFDGIGAFHEIDEHGNKLREDGEIVFPGEAQPVSYQTSAELMDLLAGSQRVRMGITRKVTQFAIGRPLIETDGPALDRIHQTAQEAGGTYAALITAIVMSDLVQKTGTEAMVSGGGK